MNRDQLLDALRELSTSSPPAADLLSLCAFLAPEDIPRDALHEGAACCPPALAAALGDPSTFADLIATLRRCSFVEVQEDTLRVHRLVQAVVRERLPDDERRAWAERAAWLVDQAFPAEVRDPQASTKCQRWLPHVRVVSEQAGAVGVAALVIASLLHRAADFSRHRSASPADTRELYHRAIAVAVPLFGAEHPQVGTLYRDLARTLLAVDADPEEAKRLAERALAIHLKSLGPHGETVARDHACLAGVHRLLGDQVAACSHMERAITIYEDLHGKDSPRLIPLLNERGFLLREKGDFWQARGLLERALEIGVARFGIEDPDVATFHANLAAVLEELHDFESARLHAERALEIGIKRYGPDHHLVAMRHNNLGVVLKSMGDIEGARVELAKAVEIGRKVFPPGNRRMQRFEKNLQAVIAESA